MYKIHMVNFISRDRSQALVLPHDLREWAPEDDPCHFIIEAVERIPIGAFKVNWKGTGKAGVSSPDDAGASDLLLRQ